MTSVVVARYEYEDGGALSVTVQVPESYPDALDEARMQAVRGLKDALEVGVDEDAED